MNSAERLADAFASYLNCGVHVRGHFRGFIDSIDAYKRGEGFLKIGTPRWYNDGDLRSCAVWAHISCDFPNISIQASEILEVLKTDPSRKLKKGDGLLHCEHVVPIKVLEEIFRDAAKDSQHTAKSVLDLHDRYFRRCIITKEENLRLDKGLKKSMPKSWRPGDSLWARYDIAGILLAKQQDAPQT